VAKMACV